jgi:hypothetical protein
LGSSRHHGGGRPVTLFFGKAALLIGGLPQSVLGFCSFSFGPLDNALFGIAPPSWRRLSPGWHQRQQGNAEP